MATLTLTDEQTKQVDGAGKEPVLVQSGAGVRFYLISEDDFKEYRERKEMEEEDRLLREGVHKASLKALRKWGEENPY